MKLNDFNSNLIFKKILNIILTKWFLNSFKTIDTDIALNFLKTQRKNKKLLFYYIRIILKNEINKVNDLFLNYNIFDIDYKI